METWLSAVGIKLATLVGGFLGALVSLKFIDGLGRWQRGTTVLAGAVASAYVTPLILAGFDLSGHLEGAVAFLVGLFGMSFGGAVIKAMPDFVAAVRERISR